MELVIDLHLHSRFSRAVSQKMTLPNMYVWGRKKGLNVLSIADFTYPLWFKETKAQLVESGDGIYRLKREKQIEQELNLPIRENDPGMHFLLSTEVACIYGQYRIHCLILAPNYDVALKINKALVARGFNLNSDGRPILGISAKNLAELLFEIDRKIVLIPAHIWTPWFSLYGSKAGYDRITDCFGDYAKYIFAVETGLSSDPSMNWRINELSSRSIVSFSDAHSLEKMGREATVLRLKNGNTKYDIRNTKQITNIQIPKSSIVNRQSSIKQGDITYSNIMNALVRGKEKVFELAYTIEFYPEEGKYHYTGHRNCGIVQTPEETRKNGVICPVCHRELTVGVMHRVEELASSIASNYKEEQDAYGTVWLSYNKKTPPGQSSPGRRPPFVNLVPLLEILSEALNSGTSTLAVVAMYDNLVGQFGSEHEVLLRAPLEKIQSQYGVTIAEGIQKVRERTINIVPGYDNTYGVVEIWPPAQRASGPEGKEKPQLGFEF
jgi:PHP family Zn ribbon phosphoesterase